MMHRFGRKFSVHVRGYRGMCSKAEPNSSTPPIKRSLFSSVTFQRVIRVIRVVAISAAIYQTGYQQGMVHFAQDPAAVEEELTKLTLGIDKNDSIERHIHSEASSTHKRVKVIGNRIINAAREHAAKQLVNAKSARAKLENPSVNTATAAQFEEEQSKWELACRRLQGNWTFVVCKSKSVNAFVSGFCPRKVFVYDGLLEQLHLTDDELAMIIGHEMSHVVLGHIEEQTPTTALVLGTQLVLMSLVDPIGLGSFLFDMAVSRCGDYIQASYSRQHEFEADELGLLLSSMACFDISSGASLHEKLGELCQHKETQLNDTHPSSIERRRKLIELANSHEKERLIDPLFSQFKRDCVAVQHAWKRAIGLEK